MFSSSIRREKNLSILPVFCRSGSRKLEGNSQSRQWFVASNPFEYTYLTIDVTGRTVRSARIRFFRRKMRFFFFPRGNVVNFLVRSVVVVFFFHVFFSLSIDSRLGALIRLSVSRYFNFAHTFYLYSHLPMHRHERSHGNQYQFHITLNSKRWVSSVF